MSAHDTFCLRVAIPRPTALPPIRSKLDVMAAPDPINVASVIVQHHQKRTEDVCLTGEERSLRLAS